MEHYNNTTHNYVMWIKSKHNINTNDFPIPSMINSFKWPPRSYTCNFCARDFRSAQALGGHMNVHRRDRAKLKQSSSPPLQQAKYKVGRKNIHHKRLTTSNPGHFFPKQIGELSSTSDLFINSEDTLSVKAVKSVPFDEYRPLVDHDGKVMCKISHTKSDTIMEDGIDLELRLGDPPVVK